MIILKEASVWECSMELLLFLNCEYYNKIRRKLEQKQ